MRIIIVINKVELNDKRMWSKSKDSDEGFDDFQMLWGILEDEDADISAKTYFEAMGLCVTSFFRLNTRS